MNNNILPSKTPEEENHISSLKDIPLKSIIDHANKIRATIIETKVRSVMKDGKSLRRALKAESLEKEEYQNLLKKIRTTLEKH